MVTRKVGAMSSRARGMREMPTVIIDNSVRAGLENKG